MADNHANGLRWRTVTGLIAAMIFVAMVAALAAPPFVQVISSAEPDVVFAATELRQQLARDGRLVLGKSVLVADAAGTVGSKSEIEAVAQWISQAEQSYIGLDTLTALAKIARARAKLGLTLDRPEARALLAQAMRIKALVLLFTEKPKQANTAFFSAYSLDPEFVPGAHQWPPEARLAYADAIAAARRDSGGILSVDISPPAATLWLNGRKAGIGPTTVSSIAPGEHFVLATCPGFNRVTAVVTVVGGGKLSQAALYLEEKPREAALRDQAVALHDAFDTEREAAAAKLLAEQVGAQNLVYITSRAGAHAAWVLDAGGARQREPVVVVPGNDAAGEIRVAILGEEPAGFIEPPPAMPPPPPKWFERWEVWLVMGAAAVVAGGTALYVGVSQGENRNMTLYLGGRRN